MQDAEVVPAGGDRQRRRVPATALERQRERAMLCRYKRDPSPGRREELIRYFMPMARSMAFKYRARTSRPTI